MPADTLAGSFQENGRLRCFTICPSADLICLQPFRYKTAEWGLLRKNLLWAGPWSMFGQHYHCAGPDTPISALFIRHYLGPCSGFGIKHVGLELDPGWITHFDEHKSYGYDFEPGNGPAGLQCAAQAATDRLFWTDNLWLIDYRTRLEPGVTYTNRERFVFFGLGCRFIEVKDGDDTWRMADSRDVKKPYRQIEDEDQAYTESNTGLQRHSLPETLDFVKKLYHSVDKYLEEQFKSGRLCRTGDLYPCQRRYRTYAPHVRLLACVFDD